MNLFPLKPSKNQQNIWHVHFSYHLVGYTRRTSTFWKQKRYWVRPWNAWSTATNSKRSQLSSKGTRGAGMENAKVVQVMTFWYPSHSLKHDFHRHIYHVYKDTAVGPMQQQARGNRNRIFEVVLYTKRRDMMRAVKVDSIPVSVVFRALYDWFIGSIKRRMHSFSNRKKQKTLMKSSASNSATVDVQDNHRSLEIGLPLSALVFKEMCWV